MQLMRFYAFVQRVSGHYRIFTWNYFQNLNVFSCRFIFFTMNFFCWNFLFHYEKIFFLNYPHLKKKKKDCNQNLRHSFWNWTIKTKQKKTIRDEINNFEFTLYTVTSKSLFYVLMVLINFPKKKKISFW